MDIGRLFMACRVGNIEAARDLILAKDVDINIRDKWDSTPLYYACLCGHTELVRFLLANGAKCEANTFDGERCVYGALTNEIRNILVQEYKVISRKVVQRRFYDEFLRKAWSSGEWHDIVFNVHGVLLKAHKCILVSRCEYFLHMFMNKWNDRQIIRITHPEVNPVAFNVLLQALYTGVVEFSLSLKEDLRKLLRQCKLFSILEMVEQHCSQITAKGKSKFKQYNLLLECLPNEDYFHLYQSAVPEHLPVQSLPENIRSSGHSALCPELSIKLRQFCDVIFKVDRHYFYCHTFFFSGQSDYFRALLSDYFFESKETIDGVKVYELTDISVEAFDALACFVYSNSTWVTIERAFELLLQSDVYLMNDLKKFCANFISNFLPQLNVIDLIRMSRMLDLPKLEMTAIEYIASNLNQFIGEQHFQELILSDANEVRERQETDTIGIIDDIRYYLKSSYKNDSEEKLKAINSLVDSLGLKLSGES